MEEDIKYFNDEWNGSIMDNPKIKKMQELYNICISRLELSLKEELIKEYSNGITILPKEYKNIKDDNRRTK